LEKIKCGIMVNNDDNLYEVVRDSDGIVIYTIDMLLYENFEILFNLHKFADQNYITLVNMDNLKQHFEHGFKPVLMWRPGRSGILHRMKDSAIEAANIQRAIRKRRGDRR
jgi:hypothetical protein